MKTTITYIFLIIIGLSSCTNNQSKMKNKMENSIEDIPSTILKIIPIDPSYIPNSEQQQLGKEFLTKIYFKNKIECKTTDIIEFVDQGQNFDSILCNLCGKNIETEYWQNAMEKADENHFTNLTIITPCCNKKTSLNELRYVTPAGFAKFVISVDDPHTEIKENDLTELEKILKPKLKIIWVHY